MTIKAPWALIQKQKLLGKPLFELGTSSKLGAH